MIRLRTIDRRALCIGLLYAMFGVLAAAIVLAGMIGVARPAADVRAALLGIDWHRWQDLGWIALTNVFALIVAAGAAHAVYQRRELRSARRERDVQDERLQALHLLDAIANGSVDVIYAKDLLGRYVFVNRQMRLLVERNMDDLLGQDDFHLFPKDVATMMIAMDREVIASGQAIGRERVLTVCGEVRNFHTLKSPLRDASGATIGVFGISRDITELKRSEAELDRLAHYDTLTELPNRRLLHLRLEHALERAHRNRGLVVILYLDLDGFKTVNDSLGHPAGDELLATVARRLRLRLREEDTLGRLGGDEFLVVLESLRHVDEAAVVARDLLDAVGEPVLLQAGREACVTASIGISVYPDDGSVSAVEMLRDADAAVYRAKGEGRNRFCYYTRDLNTEAVAKLELKAALWHALGRNEFVLFYQPQIDARTGRMVGAEALLRWNRDGKGLVPPGSFIPMAERTGLILAIGSWVIEAACRQIRDWLDAGHVVPRVAINVSARQFAAGDLDTAIDQALLRNRVPPELLEVELTESMLVENPDKTEDMLRRLKAIGIAVSLDDFGTGYSSLGYLQRFPIDTLKIDQSFVQRIGEGPDSASIVDAIVGLAHRLHLRVIAEGVETPEQRDYLCKQGCDELQGYLFSRPVPALAFEALMRPVSAPAREAADIAT